MTRWRRKVLVRVDRDSVAAGDDVMSHEREVERPAGTSLAALLESVTPEIRAEGWSWVIRVDGQTVGVWSVDHGVQLLVADRVVAAGEVEVSFAYFLQIDPAWLFQRLSDGAKPHRATLVEEFAPIAQARREEELRRREREIAARLLTADCTDALVSFGATIDLHCDTTCRFQVAGEEWTVARADTMTQVFAPGRRAPTASVRPVQVAEGWLVAALGARQREARGLPAFPAHEPHPLPGLALRHGRWNLSGPTAIQVQDGWAVEALRFAHGRSVAEIRFGSLRACFLSRAGGSDRWTTRARPTGVGAPGRSRTRSLRGRSSLLYPVELRRPTARA